ncbi:hypothetical protein DPMN_163131 [Dreissena polymorpha]|uniref:Uncharacterized protein n=1 Tax=Dreissena polymorpha TaxID=45954 RepID=A0A9D4ESW9_DREPO|nr:hypothetical protein DPMN_163131 [Dreissena polymorpha]
MMIGNTDGVKANNCVACNPHNSANYTLQNMAASMKSKFQGSLVGAVVGDCIGACFEGGWHDRVEISNILKVLRRIEKSL